MESNKLHELFEELDIVELLTKLDIEFGFENYSKLREWFGQRHFNVTPMKNYNSTKFENKIISIKYIEGICRHWQPKWSRQCRGVYLYKTRKNKIVCLKSLLQRGAEILTNIQIKTGIVETQDITSKKYDYLDKVQKDNIEIFQKSGMIEGYLSFKNDGSLLGVTLINKKCEIFDEIVENHSDNFARTVKKISEKLNLPFLPIFNSSGTLFLSAMQGYTLTAIGCGMNIIDYVELSKLAASKKPDELLDLIIPTFLMSLEKFFISLPTKLQNDIMSLSFETICENRKSCWGDIHTELAVSYPKSMIRFLGCSFNHLNNAGDFLPHFTLEESLKISGFEQPLFWRIHNSVEVEKMIEGLNLVIQGKLNEKGFYSLYKCNNSFPSKYDYLDYEGFVFYRILNDDRFDYSKIKTNSYYIAHKLKEKNMDELIKFSEFAEAIFPLSRIVKTFHLKFETKLNKIYNILNLDIKINEKDYFEDLTQEAKKTFHNYNDAVKAKIIINTCKSWTEKCFNIYKTEFDLISNPELLSSLKKLSMKIAFWESNYEQNIEVIKKKEKKTCLDLVYYLISSEKSNVSNNFNQENKIEEN